MNILALRPHPFGCDIGICQYRRHNYGCLGMSSDDIVGLDQLRLGAEVSLKGLNRYCKEQT